MSDRIWHSGPPPHVGWWNASMVLDPVLWSWWDGERWSLCVCDFNSAEAVNKRALRPLPDEYRHRMRWTDYWPEGARVPRIDPRGEK